MRPQERRGEPRGGMQGRPLRRRERRRQVGCECSKLESGEAQESPHSTAAPTQESRISRNELASVPLWCSTGNVASARTGFQRAAAEVSLNYPPDGRPERPFPQHHCGLDLTFHYCCVFMRLPLSSGPYTPSRVSQ